MLFDVASMNLFFAKADGEHVLTFWIIQLFYNIHRAQQKQQRCHEDE